MQQHKYNEHFEQRVNKRWVIQVMAHPPGTKENFSSCRALYGIHGAAGAAESPLAAEGEWNTHTGLMFS